MLGCGGGGGGGGNGSPQVTAPANLAYATNPATYTRGVVISPDSPTSTGGAVSSYSVSPSLPAGLSFSTSTGTLSGTPSVLSLTTPYSVIASNAGGSTTATLTITVNDAAPTTLVYTTNPATYTVGTTIAPNSPTNSGGAVVSYAVAPALPAGLILNSGTGVITGTPTTPSAQATYTVTATNSGGHTSVGLLIAVNIRVAPPTNLSYNRNPAVYIASTSITPNDPHSAGGAVAAYSVSPALPPGLNLNPTTGVLTGTPTASSPATTYTIAASNAGGSTNLGLSLRVAPAIAAFTVTTPDDTLVYPNNSAVYPHLNYWPDEPTSFLPNATGGFLVFSSSDVVRVAGTHSGAVVLETTDLVHFNFAAGYNSPVLSPPQFFWQCDPVTDTEFDENYAGPGTVLQDPTLPAGNLIMLYEAENHCPGGVFQGDYYATVGFARSPDGGKTWPLPINGPQGGPTRHPVLQCQAPQPTTLHTALGNAIPTGFVDRDASGDYYLYTVYEYYSGGISQPPYDGLLRIARAKLGSDPVIFSKWYHGAFSQPGIAGLDSSPLPGLGCTGGRQVNGQITYLDNLGLYLMTFGCVSDTQGGWYYALATSLDLQDWTAPRLIAGSQFPVATPCPGQTWGQAFDGWYSTFMSPAAAEGHLMLTGKVFFMNGCNVDVRTFTSRSFSITVGP